MTDYHIAGRTVPMDEGAETRYKLALEDIRRIARKFRQVDPVDDWPVLVDELNRLVEDIFSGRPALPEAELGWICAHCGSPQSAGRSLDIDTGTALTCEECGQATVVELRRVV